MKKKLSALLACVLLAGMLAGCGTAGGAKNDSTYVIWLYNAQDASFYSDYSENPALEYLLGKEWDGAKVSLEFRVPAAGSQQDNYDTMIASGDYPTLMQDSVADPAPVMYDNGIIEDITGVVKQYMPNYYGLIQSNTALRNRVMFNIGGEDRILSIAVVNEAVPRYYTGMVYRRDWLVTYGSNPVTGTAFSGGYSDPSDPDSWTDDVVFPSGGTDPVYISDWEWMFDIFTRAQQSLGITDSYSISCYYSGYTWGTGGLCASFGEGNPVWYQRSDGAVCFGGTQNSMRAYFQCLNSWYEKGWLDADFNTRTRDAFYAVDSTACRLGKVGMWQGLESDLGGRLDLNDGGYTDGIYVAGCAWPINDVYGSDECKYKEPTAVVSESLVGTGFFVMSGASKQNLGPLLTMLDYLYTEEGSVLRTVGLNAEQLSSISSGVYADNGLSGGAYTIGADGRYVLDNTLQTDSGGLTTAVNLDKLPGIELVTSLDEGLAPAYEHSLGTWTQYENKALIWGGQAFLNMSVEDNQTAQKALNQVTGYMDKNAYKFIKGSLDIDSDADWADWCSALERFKVQDICSLLQPYIDLYPVG